MLKRLIEANQDNRDYRHLVISLKSTGKVGKLLQNMGVQVRSLKMDSPFDIPAALWQLVWLIRKQQPDIVQTWLYHADLLGGVAARLAGKHHVIWSARGTGIPQRGPSMTGLAVWCCSWLSRYVPSVIVCCAESARIAHVDRGYYSPKMKVILNGYNTRQFKGDPIFRQRIRAKHGIRNTDVVVGTAGRFDPLKDFENFVKSAGMLASKVECTKFLMVGRGIDTTNKLLRSWLSRIGFAHRFVLAGEQNNIAEFLNAMDIFCLSSRKEGFPNVVCEAMATGVPCVVTDVGDAAEIVGDTGFVVAARDPGVLAQALQRMASMGALERSRLGELARRRIEERYSIETAASQFQNLYDQLVKQPKGPNAFTKHNAYA